MQALATGATARAVAACTFLPMTVVKTRFEVSVNVDYCTHHKVIISHNKCVGNKSLLFSSL